MTRTEITVLVLVGMLIVVLEAFKIRREILESRKRTELLRREHRYERAVTKPLGVQYDHQGALETLELACGHQLSLRVHRMNRFTCKECEAAAEGNVLCRRCANPESACTCLKGPA